MRHVRVGEVERVIVLEVSRLSRSMRDLTQGQELRAYQLLEAIARLHGTVSLGAVQRIDVDHFKQYARQERI